MDLLAAVVTGLALAITLIGMSVGMFWVFFCLPDYFIEQEIRAREWAQMQNDITRAVNEVERATRRG